MTSPLEQHVVDLLGQTEALLRRLEWSGQSAGNGRCCPDCRALAAARAHAASCDLARMIGAPALPDKDAQAA
ncbi:MAG TPA: hypothetical protein VF841_17325 [Anaeromyxobacter sp.]